jgi:RNA polymerase sigma-70 factor (ECF subfamily)
LTSAIEHLFRSHYEELREFAYRYVLSEPLAEEIVQDVFLALWSRREEFVPRTSARAYLFAAVRNRALHSTRHAAVVRRFNESEQALRFETDSSPDALSDIVHADQAESLKAAIAGLPDRTRLAIELRWLRQMSHAEVAEAMDISVKGVEKLLATGMRLLRRYIE